jgi:hypothetical protein
MHLLSPLIVAVTALVSFVAMVDAKTVELGQLPLSTKGRWIVDRDGNRVKLVCVNWHDSFFKGGADCIAGTERK